MKLAEALDILSKEDKPVPVELQKLVKEMNGSKKCASIFLSKYCRVNKITDELEELTSEEVWSRVSSIGAYVKQEGFEEDKVLSREVFLALMNKEFVPGGRITSAVGNNDLVTAYNCYVGPSPDDSIPGIFDTIKNMAVTMSRGGGWGNDLSSLRPKGTIVNNSAKTSTGPVSFMEVFSSTTRTIGQHQRRGAEMITLSVEHPDIIDFINSKQYDKASVDDSIISYVRGDIGLYELKESLSKMYSINHANISVRLTDKFMKAVEKDSDFELRWEGKLGDKTQIITKTVKAKYVWDQIISNAWSTGEPGLLFWDKMVKEHNGEYFEPLVSTNPCSEQPLPAWQNCNLAHINVAALVKDSFTDSASFDTDKFVKLVEMGVKFLNVVVDFNLDEKRQLPQQVEASKNSRRIGLGITGLGDCLFRLGYQYGDRKTKRFIKDLGLALAYNAYKTSINLAKKDGAFPKFDSEKFMQSEFVKRLCDEIEESGDKNFRNDLKKYGTRNCTLLTVAPVGTGSEILGGVSSGIEPIFAPFYSRRVIFSDGTKVYTEWVPVVIEYFSHIGKQPNKDLLPNNFVASHQLNPETRIEVQSLLQRYIDTAISSTINLSNSATVEDVSRIYNLAWKSGLKGITVYREGSRENILSTEEGDRRILVKKLFRSSKDLIIPRSAVSDAVRYVIQYQPGVKATIVIAGNKAAKTPQEILIWTKRVEDTTLANTLGLLLTMQLRRDVALGLSSMWLLDELDSIYSIDGAWHYDELAKKGIYIRGLAQAAKHALKLFLNGIFPEQEENGHSKQIEMKQEQHGTTEEEEEHLQMCPKCKQKTLRISPCPTCIDPMCGYSKCE